MWICRHCCEHGQIGPFEFSKQFVTLATLSTRARAHTHTHTHTHARTHARTRTHIARAHARYTFSSHPNAVNRFERTHDGDLASLPCSTHLINRGHQPSAQGTCVGFPKCTKSQRTCVLSMMTPLLTEGLTTIATRHQSCSTLTTKTSWQISTQVCD